MAVTVAAIERDPLSAWLIRLDGQTLDVRLHTAISAVCPVLVPTKTGVSIPASKLGALEAAIKQARLLAQGDAEPVAVEADQW